MSDRWSISHHANASVLVLCAAIFSCVRVFFLFDITLSFTGVVLVFVVEVSGKHTVFGVYLYSTMIFDCLSIFFSRFKFFFAIGPKTSWWMIISLTPRSYAPIPLRSH